MLTAAREANGGPRALDEEVWPGDAICDLICDTIGLPEDTWDYDNHDGYCQDWWIAELGDFLIMPEVNIAEYATRLLDLLDNDEISAQALVDQATASPAPDCP